MSDDVTHFWNGRFAGNAYKYGTQANTFLQTQLPGQHLPTGAQVQESPGAQAQAPMSAQVLVPGDGEGRNGVWLATQGCTVLAVDSSDVGVAKARALAAQAGPEVAARYHTQLADLADWAPAPGTWDAVVLIYTHLPSSIRQSAHRRLAAGLKPGGRLVLEAFHPSQLGRSSGGPKDVDMLYTLAQLRADFAGLLQETLGWEGEAVLDEGPGHQGAARLTRWVGVNSAAAT